MMMRFPTLFVNHGGGPMPLLGKQPDLVKHLQELRRKVLAPFDKPKAIVVLSAHYEADPVTITSSAHPSMLYDYQGFPQESYSFQYPAPGSPELAHKIQQLLQGSAEASLYPALANCQLDSQRGFDHGVFVPLMIMYPEADIPVVTVSLHRSLSTDINMAIGKALAPLRDEGILLLGSGYSFHNLEKMFHPSAQSRKASTDFDSWLQQTIPKSDGGGEDRLHRLSQWERAPGARIAHPREEHLMPLIVIAAAAGPDSQPELIHQGTAWNGMHDISGYLFH